MANVNNTSDIVFNSADHVIRRIYNKCKDESIKGIQIPLELYEERVLNYTNVPRQVLNEIIEQKIKFPCFNIFERILINNILLEMYKNKMSFSFKDLFEKIQIHIKLSGITDFCREMGLLGYQHVNTLNCGQIVLENPKVANERFLFLNRIKKLRSTPRIVYYLDERVIDMSRSFKKPCLHDMDISKIDGYVFFHIVSRNGFHKGLFCNQPNAEDLIKWISDIVLTTLNPSSVIIMDNSPLHGNASNGPITRYHSKEDMIKWLQDNNIPCTSNMHKAQLYDLIRKCPEKPFLHNIDLLFKSHGHEVLRLPDNYHDLSITELMWDHINTHLIQDVGEGNLLNLRNHVYEIAKNMTVEKLNQFERTIDSTEKKLLDIAESTEEILDTYKIDLKSVKDI